MASGVSKFDFHRFVSRLPQVVAIAWGTHVLGMHATNLLRMLGLTAESLAAAVRLAKQGFLDLERMCLASIPTDYEWPRIHFVSDFVAGSFSLEVLRCAAKVACMSILASDLTVTRRTDEPNSMGVEPRRGKRCEARDRPASSDVSPGT